MPPGNGDCGVVKGWSVKCVMKWVAVIAAQQTKATLKDPEGRAAKRQAFMGLPAGEQPGDPEADKLDREAAIKTIRGMRGN